MAKMNAPVDGMFRAGMISSKEWARLHPNESPGKFRSQKGLMTKFDRREKDEGSTKKASVYGTTSRNIDEGQEMGTPARAGGKPSGGRRIDGRDGGGDVKGSKKSPATRHLDDASLQKPLFPKYAGRTGNAVKGGATEPKGGQYSGGPKRPNRAMRLNGPAKQPGW